MQIALALRAIKTPCTQHCMKYYKKASLVPLGKLYSALFSRTLCRMTSSHSQKDLPAPNERKLETTHDEKEGGGVLRRNKDDDATTTLQAK